MYQNNVSGMNSTIIHEHDLKNILLPLLNILARYLWHSWIPKILMINNIQMVGFWYMFIRPQKLGSQIYICVSGHPCFSKKRRKLALVRYRCLAKICLNLSSWTFTPLSVNAVESLRSTLRLPHHSFNCYMLTVVFASPLLRTSWYQLRPQRQNIDHCRTINYILSNRMACLLDTIIHGKNPCCRQLLFSVNYFLSQLKPHGADWLFWARLRDGIRNCNFPRIFTTAAMLPLGRQLIWL